MFRFRTLLILALVAFGVSMGLSESAPAQQSAENVATSQPSKDSPDSQLMKLRAEIQTIKQAVANEGDYLCCVEPSCDWCLLHEGDCECRENLEAKKEVCPGCGLGWHNDQGVVKGVQASQVEWTIAHEHGDEHEDDHGDDGDGGDKHGHEHEDGASHEHNH